MTDRLTRALGELPSISPPPLSTLLQRPRRRRLAPGAVFLAGAGFLGTFLLGAMLLWPQPPGSVPAPPLVLAPGQRIEFTVPPFEGLLQTPAGMLVLQEAQFTAALVEPQALHLMLAAGSGTLPSGEDLPLLTAVVLTDSGWQDLADATSSADEADATPPAPDAARVPVPVENGASPRVPFHVWAVEPAPRLANAAGARVRVRWDSDAGPGEAWISTDRHGRGTALVPGEATALRIMTTAVPGALWADGPWQPVLEGLGFEADRPVRALTARLRTVRGRVLDAAGRPTAARLRVWSGTLDVGADLQLEAGGTAASEVRELATDQDGQFVLRDLGGSLALRAVTDSAASTATLQAAGAADGAEITLQLLPSITLRGQATLPDGSTPGVGQVRLSLPVTPANGLRAQGQPTHERWLARIEGDGSFVLRGVPCVKELVHLYTSVSSCAPSRSPVRLRASGSEQRVAIPLKPAVQLRGVVRQASGEPLAGVHVAALTPADGARLAETVTGPTGSFVLTDLPSGRLRIHVRPESGHAPQQFWHLTPATPGELLAITLPPVWSVQGELVDAAGQPLPGIRIALEPWKLDDQDATTTVRAAVTGPGGRFLFADLPAGQYALRVPGRRGPAQLVRPGGEFVRVRRP